MVKQRKELCNVKGEDACGLVLSPTQADYVSEGYICIGGGFGF